MLKKVELNWAQRQTIAFEKLKRVLKDSQKMFDQKKIVILTADASDYAVKGHTVNYLSRKLSTTEKKKNWILKRKHKQLYGVWKGR